MRGLAGPALPAHVMVSKVFDHASLYMSGWVEWAPLFLQPLIAALDRHVLATGQGPC